MAFANNSADVFCDIYEVCSSTDAVHIGCNDGGMPDGGFANDCHEYAPRRSWKLKRCHLRSFASHFVHVSVSKSGDLNPFSQIMRLTDIRLNGCSGM